MKGFVIKIFICPIVVFLANLVFTSVNYATFSQILLVGLTLAIVAHIMELVLLRERTFWISNIADFIGAFVTVYVSGFILSATVITFWGAILAALALSVTEYFQHRYLIRTHQVKKTVRHRH